MKKLRKLKPESRKHRKEKMEYWSARNEPYESGSENENSDSGISSVAMEYQKELARKLQEIRLEYIDKYHREPGFTDYEFGLIAKYC